MSQLPARVWSCLRFVRAFAKLNSRNVGDERTRRVSFATEGHYLFNLGGDLHRRRLVQILFEIVIPCKDFIYICDDLLLTCCVPRTGCSFSHGATCLAIDRYQPSAVTGPRPHFRRSVASRCIFQLPPIPLRNSRNRDDRSRELGSQGCAVPCSSPRRL